MLTDLAEIDRDSFRCIIYQLSNNLRDIISLHSTSKALRTTREDKDLTTFLVKKTMAKYMNCYAPMFISQLVYLLAPINNDKGLLNMVDHLSFQLLDHIIELDINRISRPLQLLSESILKRLIDMHDPNDEEERDLIWDYLGKFEWIPLPSRTKFLCLSTSVDAQISWMTYPFLHPRRALLLCNKFGRTFIEELTYPWVALIVVSLFWPLQKFDAFWWALKISSLYMLKLFVES